MKKEYEVPDAKIIFFEPNILYDASVPDPIHDDDDD